MKTWKIARVDDLDKAALQQYLDDGYEPYAVISIVGAGTFHFLRLYS